MGIVVRGTWTQRRQLQQLSQRSKDAGLMRRSLVLSWLLRGCSVTVVGRNLLVARSTVYRWVVWFEEGGVAGLERTRGGRLASVVTERLLRALETLLDETPRNFGYLRTTWSSELLAKALYEYFEIEIHCSTVRRALRRTEFRWRRARPTLHIRDPKKAEKLAAIQQAIDSNDPYTEVFFVDETDIDLNPRIGFTWSRRGQQAAIPTPGKNRKHYVAGALHALRKTYRRARHIVLILDNYIVHKTDAVAQFLARNPKFELLFQPVYYPWANRIERLWKTMHDTVTRNHRCKTLTDLCQDVKRFFQVVQPFPGAGQGVAEFGSTI